MDCKIEENVSLVQEFIATEICFNKETHVGSPFQIMND